METDVTKQLFIEVSQTYKEEGTCEFIRSGVVLIQVWPLKEHCLV